MKKTIITGLFVYPGKVGGAEIYFNNLLAGFVKNNSEEKVHLLLNRNLIDQYDPVVNKFSVDYIDVKQNRVLYDSTLPFIHSPIKKFPVVFSPNYVTTLANLTGSRSYVTTIHDLQYQHFPEFFSAKKRKWQYFAHVNTLKACRKVICISEFVKDDICRVYGEKYRNKLEVIHNPIDFSKLDQPAKGGKFAYDFPYILSVAAHYPHKNTLTLVKAFNIFNKEFPEYKLVLVGQLSKNLVGGNYESYGAELGKAFESNPNIITTGFVQDDELAQIYRNCNFFVFPSLFEGFGMPPVEAMGVGKPVITTRCGSLQEVTLNQATYINSPRDEWEIAEHMKRCCENLPAESLRAEKLAEEIRHTYCPGNISRAYTHVFDKL